MKIFEEVLEHADSTLSEAEDYTKEALMLKMDHPKLANSYIMLAEQHLSHYNDLHSQMVSIINDYKTAKGEPPEAMKMVYDILHKKEIERYTAIKRMIDQYKTM